MTGNVTLALGSLNVNDTAHINGNVEALGANVDISSDAIINGEQSILFLKSLADPNNWGSDTTPTRRTGSFLGRSIWLIFVSLALAALGLVAVLFPKTSRAHAENHPNPAAGGLRPGPAGCDLPVSWC